MDSWHLTKFPTAAAAAVAHGETGWRLVDEAGRSTAGRSLEEVVLRATGRGSRPSAQGGGAELLGTRSAP